MQPILSLNAVTIKRDSSTLVQNVSWSVHTGEHWVILGANGSGKTSLLRAIGGYLAPTAGEIELLGETYGEADWRELRKRLGFVSAGIADLLHEDDTALEIVAGGRSAMAGYWGRMDRPLASAARGKLRLVEAEDLASKMWFVLSQGERQRVLIARALMSNPRLLLLDEPCAGLDPVAREAFLNLLGRLGTAVRPVPMVLVTHHVEEIPACFTHALILRAGTALASGPIERTLSDNVLSEAFGTPVEITRRGRRFRLSVR